MRDFDGKLAHAGRGTVENRRQDVLHAHEIRHEGTRGPLEDVPDRPGLHDGPVMHDRRAGGERQGLGKVVRHHEKGDVRVPVELLEQQTDVFPESGVQGGEGFVQQDHPRLHHEGPCQGHPLEFSPAERLRVPMQKVADAEIVHEPAEALPGGRPVVPVIAQAKGYVVLNAQMREEGIVLVHDSHTTFLRLRPRDIPAADGYASSQNRDQPSDGLQQDGLARTGGAHEHKESPVLDGKVDIPEAEFAEMDPETPDLDHAVFFPGSARTLRTRNRVRHTSTSQTATGWEYLSP